MKRTYIRKTNDDRYGLTADGALWRIAGRNSYLAGHVADPDNIEIAAMNADEEMNALMAEARQEFGY